MRQTVAPQRGACITEATPICACIIALNETKTYSGLRILVSGISSNSIVTSWSKGDKPDPDSRKVSVHTMSHTERKVNLINKFTIAHFTINLKKKPFSLHGMLGCIVSFSRWLDTPISS